MLKILTMFEKKRLNLSRISSSKLARQIASDAFWSVLGNCVGKGLTFLSMILVARVLGKEAFGEFGLVKSTALTFVTFSAFGMGLTATKYIAELLPSDKERVGRILGLSYIFTCFSSLLVALAFWFVAPWLCKSVLQSPHLVGLMQLSAVLLFLLTFCMFQQGVLSGFQDFQGVACSNIIHGVMMVPTYVIGAYYWGLTGVVIGTIIAAGLNAFINSVFIYRNTKRHNIHYLFSQASRELGILGRFSLPVVLSSILYFTSFWGCQMMLGSQQSGFAQLGVFYAAFSVFTVLTAVPLMLAPIYIAKLSELFGNGDIKRFRKTIFLSFGTCVPLAVTIALPFLCFPSLLMTWCFGESFRSGGTTLALLSLTAIFWVINGVFTQVMASIGGYWIHFAYCLAGVVTTLFVAFWSIPAWGSFGLALALLLGSCTRVIFFVPIWYRLDRLWKYPSSLGKAT